MKDSGDWCRGLILDCIDYDTRYQSFFYSTKPKYTFADGEVLLISKHVGWVNSALMTSREPSGLCPGS